MHGFSGMNSNMKVKVAAVTSQNATDHISLLCFQPQYIIQKCGSSRIINISWPIQLKILANKF